MYLETIPDTSAYMIGGYAFAFTAMAIYVASLFIRTRNLKQDLSTLESLEKESRKKEVKSKPTK
jgi:hypothetical protein